MEDCVDDVVVVPSDAGGVDLRKVERRGEAQTRLPKR